MLCFSQFAIFTYTLWALLAFGALFRKSPRGPPPPSTSELILQAWSRSPEADRLGRGLQRRAAGDNGLQRRAGGGSGLQRRADDVPGLQRRADGGPDLQRRVGGGPGLQTRAGGGRGLQRRADGGRSGQVAASDSGSRRTSDLGPRDGSPNRSGDLGSGSDWAQKGKRCSP